ncbi:protein PTHB1 [Phlebotomus argentipes]|uniref:protein PTHB1 n=1 Tax=Phlebotomus argentipes TaxID=94469 RepID=UPI0028931AC4|nr:protein PTHB1 [Phlebotomus argentipes]
MSLFRVITWWKTQCPSTSGFDSLSLLCGRLGLSEDGEKDAIAVGSHSGHLSIFAPSPPQSGATFSPTDVLLEVKLPQPVIGLACGKFSSSRSDNRSCLAVLHPMKLSVFWVTATEGVADHGAQFRLQLAYESILTKFAFSLCHGGFGGVKGKEFLCITHMDGGLKFFEQDGISYEAHLPEERTIPSPMKYISRIDCFVTVAPSGFVECFKYQDLAQSADNVSGQQIFPFWTFFIGEGVIDLAVHQVTNNESVVIVLGEHNLFCLTDTGKVKFIKKLDYTAVCLHTFVIGWYWEPDVRLMIAIATEMGSFLIYEESKLIWSAQLPEVPVAVTRGTFTDLSGGIVTLSDTGVLTVGFLGSEPQIFKVPALNLKHLTVEKAQKELEDLEGEIKSGIDFTDISLINAAAERELSVNVSISKVLVQSIYAPKDDESDDGESPKMCEISVVLKASIAIDHAQVIVNADPPLMAKDPVHVFRDVESKATRRVSTWIYMAKRLDPPSLQISVLVSSINRQGIPRVCEKKIFLPIGLVYKSGSAQKEAKYKIVVEAENVAKNVAELFAEMQFEASAQAIAFKSIYSGISTTIVAAKNSNRYRIQSDNLEALSGILSLFLSRLQTSPNDSGEKIKISGVFFTEELIHTIDNHARCAQEMKDLIEEIDNRLKQMRLIQRSILSKLQNKSSEAITGLHMLLKLTHEDILRLMNLIRDLEGKSEDIKINLSCILNILRETLKYCGLPNYVTENLQSVLVTPINDWTEQIWEESIAAPVDLMSHVGVLSKHKGMDFDENYSFLVTNPFDLARLKRQLVNLFDRVTRLIAEGTSEVREEGQKELEISDWLNEASPTIADG